MRFDAKMGYDIFAYDDVNHLVGYIYPVAGTFRTAKEHGYDWFALIGAKEHDRDVSGNGGDKLITFKDLNRALKAMDTRRPMGTAEMEAFMVSLKKFMEAALRWCQEKNMAVIKMGFY